MFFESNRTRPNVRECGHALRRVGSGDGGCSACYVNDEEGDFDDVPQPSLLPPKPEPRVPAAVVSLRNADKGASGYLTSLERVSRATSQLARSVAGWTSLLGQLQGGASVSHLQRLDLSGTVMNNGDWSWFCRDVLPTMVSLSFLKLSRTGLTDRRLVQLFQDCQMDRVHSGAALSSSSFSVLSKQSTSCLSSRHSGIRDVSRAPRSRSSTADTLAATKTLTAAVVGQEFLRRLTVLDLGWNHLTYRSAVPLGKFLLFAADTLDELHLLGNPLQDYGFQILGIYLAKLHLSSLLGEQHLFSSSLVRRYLHFLKQTEEEKEKDGRRASKGASQPQHAARRVPSHALTSSELWDVRSSSQSDTHFFFGISFLDLRDCQASARGVSEVLAGASRAHRLETLLLACNTATQRMSTSLDSADAVNQTVATTLCGKNDNGSKDTRSAAVVGRFSSFRELHHPCALKTVSLCGVLLSKLCTPIGCRELFLNLFFCCPELLSLDVSESFDRALVSPSLLLQVLSGGQRLLGLSFSHQRMALGSRESAEFTLDFVMIGEQACVGDIFCELLAHAAFNAERRHSMAPSAFCYLQELHLNGTGITDVAAQGLAFAVRSSDLTGVLSSLTVLNMADNLLTVSGCLLIMHAFILDWSSPPSLLSALALHGNEGVHHNDADAISTLRQVADAAVQRRCEERRMYDHKSLTVPLLPLSIHLGGAGAAAFTVVSNEEVSFTSFFAKPADRKAEGKEDDGDRDLLFKMEGVTSNTKSTLTVANSVCGEGAVGGSDSGCLSPDHLRASKTISSAEVSIRNHASSHVPSKAQVAAPCELSTIHARESPQRFFSNQVSPSIPWHLQNFSRVSGVWQEQEGNREEKKPKKRLGPRLLSPAFVNDSLSGGKNTSSEYMKVEGLRNSFSAAMIRRSADLPAQNAVCSIFSASLEQCKGGEITRKEAGAHYARRLFCGDDDTAVRPPLFLNQQESEKREGEKIQQDNVLPSLDRNSFFFSGSSKNFEFGSLFVSKDDNKVNGLWNGSVPDVSLLANINHTDGKEKRHVPHIYAETVPCCEENEMSAANSLGNAPRATVEPKTATILTKDKPHKEENEQDIFVMPTETDIVTKEQEANASNSEVQGQTHAEQVEKKELLMKTKITRTIPSPVHESPMDRIQSSLFCDFSNAGVAAEKKYKGTDLDDVNQSLQSQDEENHTDNDDLETGLFCNRIIYTAEKEHANGKEENEVLYNGENTRRLERHALLYEHPEGHVLCRGWKLLNRSDSAGADARKCAERDILDLLQPQDNQQGQVVSAVTLMLESPGVVDKDVESCGGGTATSKLWVVSNERRSVLAERMKRGADTNPWSVAFPRLAGMLRQTAEDTVEIVDAMLYAADGLLPAEYCGVSAEGLVHAWHGAEDKLLAELGAVLGAANDRGTPTTEVTVNEKETSLSRSSFLATYTGSGSVSGAANVLSVGGGAEPSFGENPHIFWQQVKQEVEYESEGQLIEGDTTAACGMVSLLSVVDGSSEGRRSPETTQAEPPSQALRLIPPVENSTHLDASRLLTVATNNDTEAVTNSNNRVASDGGGGGEALTRPEQRLSHVHVKTFSFFLPHPEGHCFCRGWNLLHRADSVGEEARERLEKDVLLFLRAQSSENGFGESEGNTGGVGGAVPATSIVESVSFLWGEALTTMQLRVVTSERRATISRQLQQIINDGNTSLPRFTQFLNGNRTYDIIDLVGTYLQRQPLEELHKRIISRFFSVSTLVHYYHGNETAMLSEIGAADMAQLVETVVFNANGDTHHGGGSGSSSGDNDNSIASSVADALAESGDVFDNNDHHYNYDSGYSKEVVHSTAPERLNVGNSQEVLLLEHDVNGNQGISKSTQQRVVGNTNNYDDKVVSLGKEEEIMGGGSNFHSASKKSDSFTSPGVFDFFSVTEESSNILPLALRERDGWMSMSQTGTMNENSIPECVNNTTAVINRSFADVMRRLYFVAYNAIVQGEILLDKRQRRKVRICKGIWDRQSVTIAVEWDVFLVVHFVKKTKLGLTSRKSLFTVHPVASGVHCFIDTSSAGSQQHNLNIILEREYSPEELGFSLPNTGRRLQEAITPEESRSCGVSSGRWALQHGLFSDNSSNNNNNNNSSIYRRSLFLDQSGYTVSLPGMSQLTQRALSIKVKLCSFSKAEEAASAICVAGQRAKSMMQQSIAAQDSHSTSCPSLLATPI